MFAAFRPVRSNSSEPSIFYLIFGVPKVTGRTELRLVFDAAARSGGKCLNDFITSGPILENPLAAVFVRFQEGAIGWSADISAFSRIRLKDMDRPIFIARRGRQGDDWRFVVSLRGHSHDLERRTMLDRKWRRPRRR